MTDPSTSSSKENITSFDDFIRLADYSLMDKLNADPDAKPNGENHHAREVFSGHYVPVTPTPLPEPEYISHSSTLFEELGLSNDMAHNKEFSQMFSGDLSVAREPMRPYGWATGYVLSIYD
mgnify:CR=1 FL=1